VFQVTKLTFQNRTARKCQRWMWTQLLISLSRLCPFELRRVMFKGTPVGGPIRMQSKNGHQEKWGCSLRIKTLHAMGAVSLAGILWLGQKMPTLWQELATWLPATVFGVNFWFPGLCWANMLIYYICAASGKSRSCQGRCPSMPSIFLEDCEAELLVSFSPLLWDCC
jgi:hypothetical protein